MDTRVEDTTSYRPLHGRLGLAAYAQVVADLHALPSQPPPLAQLQVQPARALEPADFPRAVRRSPCLPRSSPTTSRSSPSTRASCCSRYWSTIPKSKFGGFLAVTDYKDNGDPRRDREARLGHLAAHRLLLSLHQQGLSAHQECRRPVPRLSGTAAMVDAGRAVRRARRHRSRATRRSATATGSAPTTRAATCWPG